jgi:hypothetical protein
MIFNITPYIIISGSTSSGEPSRTEEIKPIKPKKKSKSKSKRVKKKKKK